MLEPVFGYCSTAKIGMQSYVKGLRIGLLDYGYIREMYLLY